MNLVLISFIIVLILFSLLTFILYGYDKARAASRQSRIKERTLLGLAALGGAVGAILGQLIFRHKTKKIYFDVVNITSLLLEIIVLVLMIKGLI